MAEPFAAQQRAWGRWTPLAGVAAVVLWVTSVLTGGAVPDTFEATGDEWLTYITGNEGRILVSRLLFLLGDFLFIWFLATLRTRLSAAEEEPRLLTAVAFGSGIATAVMLIAAVTPVLAASAAADALEPAAAQGLAVAEYAFFIGAEIAGAALVSATGVLAIRTAALPAWLGWASLVLALALLVLFGPVGFIAVIVGFPLWVLVVSILLWRRGEPAVPARRSASPGVPRS
jgi:hypothetical protein